MMGELDKNIEKLEYLKGSDLGSLFLRMNSSDAAVVGQIFIDEAYNLRALARFEDLQGLLAKIRASGKRPLIVDAGANIGIASIYFAAQCRDALIVAIEPERNNFCCLRENVRGLSVIPIEGALASTSQKVKVIDPDAGFWGFRTVAVSGCEDGVPSVTVPEILDAHRDDCAPFVVKIDIEGFEDDVFRHNTAWIDEVPVLIVELHDWLYPKQGTSKNFLKAMASRDRDYIQIGENVFSIRNDPML